MQNRSSCVLPSLGDIKMNKRIIYDNKRGCFFLNFQYNGKRYRNRVPDSHSSSPAAAREYAADFYFQLTRGYITEDSLKPAIFEDVFKDYLLEKYQNGNCPAFTGGCFEKYLKEIDRTRRLLKLYKRYGKQDMKKINWLNERTEIVRENKRKGNQPTTTDKEISQINTILEYANSRGLINVKSLKKLNGVSTLKKRTLSEDEIFSIIQIAKQHYPHLADPMLFAYLTGLRLSNIRFLRKEHLIMGNTQIFLPAYGYKGKHTFSQTLCKMGKEIINRNIKADPSNPIIFKHARSKDGTIGCHKSAFNSIRKKADIEHKSWIDGAGKKRGWWDWSFHGIRHSTGTDMSNRGMTIQEIHSKLGHAKNDLRMTMRYVLPNEQAIQRDAADRAKRLEKLENLPAYLPADGIVKQGMKS